LPNRVRVWSTLEEDSEKMINADNHVKPYGGLKNFIAGYVKEIT